MANDELEPEMMRAFTLVSMRGGGVTEWRDMPRPVPGNGEVVVRVAAAGFNPLDGMVARGEFRGLLHYRLPLVLGQEMAGTVVDVGTGVSDVHVGDAVFARTGVDTMGAFAPFVRVAARDVAPWPAGLDAAQAASLPLVLLTALQAFTEKAPVHAGDRVFIQGGAGGLGSVAVQVARYLGAEVSVTVSGKDADFVRSLGATTVVDYRTQRYEDVLSPQDVVLDTLGGAETLRAMHMLRPGGTLVSVVGNPTADFAGTLRRPYLAPAMQWLSRRERRLAAKLGVSYRFLFMRPDGAMLRSVVPALEDGTIRPVVGQELAFDRIGEFFTEPGHRGSRPGKTVFVM